MKIGELSERTGIASSRIRFYERMGLLKAVQRKPNGYRTYPPEAVFELELVTAAQDAGFSLDEIAAMFPSDMANWQHRPTLDTLRQKVLDIEAMEARMARTKAHLVSLVAEIENKPDEMDCNANARRVLTQIRERTIASPAPGAIDLYRPGKSRGPR
jgi:DNA-binding transcriptional MerR regulator